MYKLLLKPLFFLFDPEFGFPIDPDEGGLGDDDDNS